ncbi:major facilitator superfamily transporter [Colletotrichum graminicola]|uniref:Major facilitator superfamily transporter n=1 Tax=Colletotrichum graminicola (strain M1.001 / M2 / FGSC 10212) TaxID=645133 RepID=E3Q9C4_COLGM|nr:major facilitator superfamily transporter [Colletotrichum graminicola M1.001]EFQ27303.1 major facilitator superfamily transporter [Colletotrichum graminicola M1.001]WDK13083.1 major facilitator superfamily transporter [Colletotrichum graminicola]
MATSTTALSHNASSLPPGTVLLSNYGEATESTSFVVSPTPTSDPNEPLNWTKWRKCVNYGLIMAVTVAAFTNLSIQTVFWQQMTVDLDLSISRLSQGQSAQLAGLATGCIFFIPFTVKYGRRSTYLVSTAVLAAAAWWTASMHTYTEMIITNIITGLAGAINETAVQMTIADLFFLHQRGSANGLYFTAVMIGSFLTPLVAGAQAATQGWRWSYYYLSIALTILSLLFAFLYEETKYTPAVISQHQRTNVTSQDHENDVSKVMSAAESSFELNDAQFYAASSVRINTYRERMRLLSTTPESLTQLFILPLHVITLPHVMFTALQLASGVSWLIMYMSVVSVVFSAPPYNFNTQSVGLMTLGPFVGNLLGSLYGGPFADWAVMRLSKKNGWLYEPEMRLYLLFLPVISMAGGIMMFGITSDRGMHWIFPSIGGALFAFGLGANGDITFTLVIDTYKELTGEAFVGIAFIRNAVSAGVPSALVPWMSSMGLTNMHILSGVVSLLIGLLHVPFIIWGKRIRAALAPRYWRLVEKRKAS